MAKSMPTGIDLTLHNGKKGKAQVRSVRQDGWTAAKRAVFLDHVAATCNISASADAVGLWPSSAYSLRRRDPDFAAQWHIALETGFDRLQAMLIERAMGPMTIAIGDTPVPDITTMDTDLALRLIEFNRKQVSGGPKRRGGPAPGPAASEDVACAAILKKLDILRKRIDAKKA